MNKSNNNNNDESNPFNQKSVLMSLMYIAGYVKRKDDKCDSHF